MLGRDQAKLLFARLLVSHKSHANHGPTASQDRPKCMANGSDVAQGALSYLFLENAAYILSFLES